ncbi:MAG: riboflavin biosynthesis protein RibF, partial [Clostridia bacterium]|nr:riboflavin biosynthesis protein RibF [Clostridia bacterium]
MKNIIALGFFDGVHIGHRQILKRTVELGKELGLNPCAFTMRNHPKGVLTGKAPLKLVSSKER